MRFAPLSLATIIAASLSLTSCASSSSDGLNCTPAMQPGSLTASTTVSGVFGEQPTVELPSNTAIQSSEREVLDDRQGQGRAAAEGDLLSINFAVFDGDTGTELDGTTFSAERGAAPVLVTPEFSFPALFNGILCAQAGDRLLIAAAPNDGLGEASATEWGISPDTTILLVIDVVNVSSPQATGAVRQLPSGFPNVVTTQTGQVGIVLPPSAPAAEIEVAERIVGDGPAVSAEDVVFGQAVSVDWATRSLLSSTWAEGSPTSFGSQAQGTDIRGFLTGYPVGSQIVMLLPSPTGATVHVVDILAVG